MPSKVSGFLLIIASSLIPLSLVIFAVGFFPYKPFLPGNAAFNGSGEVGTVAVPFDKVVFMVVDALRRYIEYVKIDWIQWLTSLVTLCIRPNLDLSLPKSASSFFS